MVKICSNNYTVSNEEKYAQYFEKYPFPLSSFQKYVSVNKDDIKKGKDLYSKEFDVNEDREIKEFVRKYPMEKVLGYYLKNR